MYQEVPYNVFMCFFFHLFLAIYRNTCGKKKKRTRKEKCEQTGKTTQAYKQYHLLENHIIKNQSLYIVIGVFV